jgi:hypothetical protein
VSILCNIINNKLLFLSNIFTLNFSDNEAKLYLVGEIVLCLHAIIYISITFWYFNTDEKFLIITIPVWIMDILTIFIFIHYLIVNYIN